MNENRPKRRLKVDLSELELALDNYSWEINYYLDLETGQVILLTDETQPELDRLHDLAYDMNEQEIMPVEEAIQQLDLYDWQAEMVLLAHEVEIGFGTRYVAIPRSDSHEAWRDMQDFIGTVRDERLGDYLWDAIQGRGAFRCFRDILARHPDERDRWYDFKNTRQRERMLEWLASEGIEPINVASIPQTGFDLYQSTLSRLFNCIHRDEAPSPQGVFQNCGDFSYYLSDPGSWRNL